MGLDVGSLIKESFRVLFRDKIIFGTAVVLGLIGLISYFPVSPLNLAYSVYIIIAMIIVALFSVFLNAIIVSRVYESKKDGFGYAANNAKKYYLRFLGTYILLGVIVGLGFIAFVIPGVYLAVRLFLAPATVIAEKKRPFDALKRSWEMTRGNWWSIFAVALVLSIIAFFIGLIPVIGTIIGMTVLISSVLIYKKLK